MPPETSAADVSAVSDARSWLHAPFLAVQFLTVLPPLVRRPLRPCDLGRSESFFPLAGLLLGALLAGTELLLQAVVAQPVRDVLLVALLAALTGALHLDGIIDTFDGIFAHGGRARRLEIMRDPRAGAFGVVGVVLLLALKLAALGSLPQDSRLTAMLLAPPLGRWAIVLVTRTFPYARPEGMGRSFKDAVRWTHVAIAGTMAAVLAWVIAGPGGLMVAGSVSVLALLVARWMAGRLGGLSGDSYGAVCELTEAGVLVALGLQIGGVGG
jgi:adenosylcobinamide-GDP ribazoletransferase